MKNNNGNRISPEIYECKYCGIKFRYKSNLRDHMKRCIYGFGVIK